MPSPPRLSPQAITTVSSTDDFSSNRASTPSSPTAFTSSTSSTTTTTTSTVTHSPSLSKSSPFVNIDHSSSLSTPLPSALPSTPSHLPHLSGTSAAFASLTCHHTAHSDSQQVAAAAAATSSRLRGLGTGMKAGITGSSISTSHSSSSNSNSSNTSIIGSTGVVAASQGLSTIESLKEAVMRSQNRVRKKSKLDQATLAFNSPPLLSDDASQSESAQQTSFLDTGTSQSNDLYNSTIDAATGANTSTTCKTSTRSISPLAEATKARKSKSTKLCSSSSFPFPPMRTMSSSSIGAAFNSPGAGPLDRILPSGAPTPASVAFLPPGSTLATTYENPDFPTPNMYELTLLLHSEPGIEAFWSNVVKIATTCYKAERVTLAIPSDSTDLENTPWGQKASFNMADNDRLSLTYLCGSQDRDHDDITFRKDYDEDYENHDQDGEGGEGGEDDESRYQGNGEQIAVCNDMDPETIEPVQIDTNAETPFGPVTIGLHDLHDAASNSDWISVTSGMSPGDAPDPPPLKMDQREGSADRAYRSDESEVKGRVFPGLQPLNFEADALLDETGVSRVLQRGKTVVLSREYRDVKTHLEEKEQRRKGGVEAAKESPSPKSVKPGSKGPISPSVSGFGNLDLPKGSFKKASSQPSTPLFFVGKGGRRRRKPSSQDCYAHNPVMQFYSTQQHMHHVQSRTHSPNRSSPFEEYEQPVTSPWSQSPAPSPAPRQDASENPFFAQPKVDEETFNPVTTTPVYSAKEPVSAIGCESSWTVIHIPLVHPSQSKSLDSGSAFPATERSLFGSGSNMDLETHQKRAPIAILSMLSPVIPYPSNLIHSLSHFAPLVATAYSLASTHTSVVNQLDCLRKKRSSRRRPPMQRMSSYYAGGMQSPETILGSITSPSDTSSGFTVSNVASPMWDQVGVGGRGSPSQAGSDRNSMKSGNSIYATPGSPFSFAVSESAESYFTRGRPPIFSRQSSNGCVDGCGGCSIPSVANRGLDIDIYGSLDARLSNDGVASISDGNRQSCSSSPVSSTNPVPDDKTPTGKEAFIDKGKTSQKTENSIEPEKVCIRSRLRNHVGASHTYLHSYGADYATTFQNLAGTSTQSTRRRGSGKSGAKSIRLNLHAMPPPSNRLLRTIVDSIPVHVFTAVPDTGQLTWVNARMLAYRGTSPEKFLAAPWDAIHPEDKDEYMRRWGIAIRRGDPLSHQMRVRRFDGVYRWFMVRAVPLRDQRGIIVHWFGTNMDIHDQRLAEVNAARQAEMAESESKYRSLANSSPQIVFAATANDGITFANTQWLGYSGQTLEQAMKLGFMGQVHPSDRHKCCLPGNDGSFAGMSSTTKFSSNDNGKAPLEKDSPAGGTYSSTDDDKPTFSTELRLQDKYGDYRWHLVRCVSVGSKVDNRQGLWFGTCTDINDHKLLEQKLKEANEAAQRTMESKTRFLANMSHEIRTPLIGISGMVTFLLDTDLSGEQLDYCHTISQSSDGLLSVINDILDLSKVEAGMMRLNREWFRMRSLIEDAHELLSTMAIAKDLELNFIVDTDVPIVLSGDRVRLRQVLLNIIGNAIKFTNKGEVFSRYSVMKVDGLKADEVMLSFECHDTGPGFDAKDEESMFKPFSQIDGSSTRVHGGSGLGLVISRQLVELHGGSLTAKSVKGQGSTFIATAVFKVPNSPSETTATPGDGAVPAEVESPQPLHMNQHVSESDSFVDSPPGLSYTDGSPSTASANPSLRSMPSDHSAGLESALLKQFSIPIPPLQPDPASMRLSLPADAHEKSQTYQPSEKQKPVDTASDLEKALIPPIFSILVVSEQPYSRIAISHHIRVTLPKNIPNKITCVGTFLECSKLIAGEDPVVFTHLVISLPEHSEIITLISHILEKPIHSQTTILILTNPNQRTAIIQNASEACDKLGIRLQFIYKPIKPSRFGDIFDPAKERDASMDRYRGLAQQVVETQKKVFSHLEHEVGNKGYKVLLVEDNRVNQKVLLRFLAKVGLEVETASDGEECVEKVFSKGPGHYGLILCDLHMPRKDGFQATAEIRQWETEKKVPHVPIVALSANVMSDVADKCATAGFSRYVTKPVDFKELSATIKDLLPSASTSLPSNEDHELKKMNQMETRRVEDDKGSVPRITKTERVSGEHERPGDDVPGDKVLGEGR